MIDEEKRFIRQLVLLQAPTWDEGSYTYMEDTILSLKDLANFI